MLCFYCCSCLELNEEYVEIILKWSWNRIDTLKDLVKNELAFIWVVPSSTVALDEEQHRFVTNLIDALREIDLLEKNALKDFFKQFAKENNVKYATLMKTLRSLLSGLKVGKMK